MDKDLLQPAATIVAGLISADKTGASDEAIKTAFIRVYRQLEEAKKELTPHRSAGVRPLKGLT